MKDNLSPAEKIIVFLIALVLGVAITLGWDGVIWYIWNYLVADFLHAPHIGFWTLFGIIFLIGIHAAGLLILIHGLWTAPSGYEDENGFHESEED